jgi:hypothetical protein
VSAIITAEQQDCITIPLDETDTAAWQDALALMHPSRTTARLSLSSAARLLLLAAKYDMPAVTGVCAMICGLWASLQTVSMRRIGCSPASAFCSQTRCTGCLLCRRMHIHSTLQGAWKLS